MSHSLNNSTAMRFIQRSSEFSTHGSRTGANLLGWGVEEDMSPEQVRECLVKHKLSLQRELAGLPKKHEHRKAIGQELHQIDNEIAKIRPKIKGGKEAQDHFITAAKELLPKDTCERIWKRAKQLYAAERDRRDGARTHA